MWNREIGDSRNNLEESFEKLLKPKENKHLVDLSVHGRIILKWVLRVARYIRI
jgi:hypothetical protein